MKRSNLYGVSVGILVLCMLTAPVALSCDTALLIMDVQTYYLETSSLVNVDLQPVLPSVVSTIAAARAGGIQLIYIQTLDPQLPEDDPRLEFADGAEPVDGDFVVTKTGANAFVHTDLESILESQEISRLIICGLWTTCCVKYAVSAAGSRGFEVIVVADAHGDSVIRIGEIKTWNETWDAMNGVSVVRLADIDFSSFCP